MSDADARMKAAHAEALRRSAQLESRSDVAPQAMREYVESHSRAELIDQVLDDELHRYAEALERLGGHVEGYRKAVDYYIFGLRLAYLTLTVSFIGILFLLIIMFTRG